ncbi:MAG: DEAD/DEAH box helicase, partial [Verrucomicrobiota bacterium]
LPYSVNTILSHPPALEKIGHGLLAVLSGNENEKIYGRSMTVADRLNDDRIIIAKWIRRLTNWNGRQATLEIWQQKIAPLVETQLAQQNTPVVRFETKPTKILALVSIADLTMRVPVDKYGVAWWCPTERDVFPPDCAICPLVPVCEKLPTSTGVALLWRRLGLVEMNGAPTRRGKMVSFFSHGDGLAVAAALEDEKYPMDELVYDLANLDAGFRFCGEENRYAGRLAQACYKLYGAQSIPGYLENGAPPKYGSGAEQVVAGIHKNPLSKHAWVTELLGAGDIDRVIIEWRSMMRQIAHAPELDWPRWLELQSRAKNILQETESPTMSVLPQLEYHQTKRVEHRLILRRH